MTSFFGKPFVEFLDLRRKVHEEIVYTGNVRAIGFGIKENKVRFDEAVENLRRLGARVQAMNVSAAWPLRLFLEKTGYNLGQAGAALIGLSNSFHLEDGSRDEQTNAIQKGLDLPRDYTDEILKQVVAEKRRHPG